METDDATTQLLQLAAALRSDVTTIQDKMWEQAAELARLQRCLEALVERQTRCRLIETAWFGDVPNHTLQ
jgi:hypothetical protein